MASFLVTTLVDELDSGASNASPGGTGLSLREAIGLANANAGADTISFDSSLAGGVAYLTQGSSIEIDGPLTVIGHLGADGRPDITISGDAARDDVHRAGSNVVTDWAASTAAATLQDNVGIFAVNGPFVVNGVPTNTKIQFSIDGLQLTGADLATGAIAALNADVSVLASAIVGNGSSVSMTAGLTELNLTVSSSTVSHNGSGVSNFGTVTVLNSTVAGNLGIVSGGLATGSGIFGKTVALTNTTVADNVGVGIFATGSGSLTNSTISGNQSGVAFVGSGTFTNSIVLGNGSEIFGGNNTFAGLNIVGVGTDTNAADHVVNASSLGAVFDALAVNHTTGLLSGVLADNGGQVATIALRVGFDNPAIDSANASAPGSDARGVARIDNLAVANLNGTAADLGAFESGVEKPSLIVTTLDDVVDAFDGLTSLREAVNFANGHSGADIVTFDPGLAGGMIRLTHASGTLRVTDALTIDAGASPGITISGDAGGNDVHVAGTVGITDIAASAAAGRLADNVQIIAYKANLTLNELILSGGVTGGNGGAVFADDLVSRLTINHATIAGNQANAGGGVFAVDATLADVTLSGNSAAVGGGIFASGLSMTNATVSGNSATNVAGGVALVAAGTLTNVTVSGNSAANDGGGLYVNSQLTLVNSIVLGNGAATNADVRGSVTAAGLNVIGVGTDTSAADHIINAPSLDAVFASVGANPFTGIQSGLLADNGGGLATIALKIDANNPAVDAADGSAPASDARGEARYDSTGNPNVNGSAADLGAFELRPEASSLHVTILSDVRDPFDFETSLREAIDYADSHVGPDIITFDPSLKGGVVTLAQVLGTLVVTDALTIEGDVDGDHRADITISGDTAGDDLHVVGSSTITDIASSGAGNRLVDNLQILSTSANLFLDALVLSGGVSGGSGGAVSGGSGTTITLTSATIAGNSAAVDGGGVAADTMLVTSSTISGNSAGGFGGGIAANSIVAMSSTISGNSAITGGGAYAGTQATLTNATVADNTAITAGGGIFSTGGVTLLNATFSGNSAGGEGGGLAGANLDLTNSIILGNGAPSGREISPSSITAHGLNIVGVGSDTDAGDHIINASSVGSVFGTIQTYVSTGLISGLLTDNGGPVETIALKVGTSNPAIDTADTTAPAEDARGIARIDMLASPNANGSIADLGAAEMDGHEPASLVVTTLADTIDSSDGFTSLREAIAYANGKAGADTITFDASLAGGVLRLGSTLQVNDALTIDADQGGDGTPDIIISGDAAANDNLVAGSTVVTDVAASISASTLGDNVMILLANADLTIDGLVLTGGYGGRPGSGLPGGVAPPFNSGGAIGSVFFDSHTAPLIRTVTITDSEIVGNFGASSAAGGVGVSNGAVNVDHSTFSGNVGATGGAISANSVSVTNSTIDHNQGTRAGGILGGQVTGGVAAGIVEVTNSSVSDNQGIGLFSFTKVYLTGTTIDNNAGGGILASNLTLTGSTVSNNAGTLVGGAAANTVTVESSIISHNSIAGSGGGISAEFLRMTSSSVTGNQAQGGAGLVAHSAILIDSTVSGNAATNVGGGILADIATLTNTTVSGNHSGTSGGGIFAGTGSLVNATVSGNSATTSGGGVFALNSMTVANSIILGNGSQTDAEISGTVTATGLTIIGVGVDADATDNVVNAASIGTVFARVDADPNTGVQSGHLADHGGPVQTIALTLDPSNVALDGADATAPARDARGVARSDLQGIGHDGTVFADLGAFELVIPSTPGVSLATDTGVPGDRITSNGGLALTGIEAGARVEYSVDHGATWQASFVALEGQNAVVVRQVDLAGYSSQASAELTFTLDTIAPGRPVVSLTHDSGVPGDGITTDARLTVDNRETDSLVEFSNDHGVTWAGTYVPHVGLTSAVTRQTDLAGNVSPPSAEITFTFLVSLPPIIFGNTVSYDNAIGGVAVDLGTQTGERADAIVTFAGGPSSVVPLATDSFTGIANAYGGAFEDFIVGNDGANVLSGGAGSDSLFGGGGDDTIYFDAADRMVDGGAGLDIAVFAGNGDLAFTATDALGLEYLISGAGDDVIDARAMTLPIAIVGGAGDDTLTLGSGGGVLVGDAGDDLLTGGTGADILAGGIGADELHGGDGDDLLYFDEADTVVEGGAGFDFAVLTGTGNLHFTVTEAMGLDYVIGGPGDDVIDASALFHTIAIEGGAGNDMLTLGSGGGVLVGGAGDDILAGSVGADVLAGSEGADQLHGGEGSDVLYFDDADTLVHGGAGFDAAVFAGSGSLQFSVTDIMGLETVTGGAGDDAIDAGAVTLAITIDGGGGNDVLTLGASGGVLLGGDGADALVGGAGSDQFAGGSGDDHFFIGAGGIDTIYDFAAHGPAEHDVIDLHGTGIASFADLHIDLSQGGGWSLVTAGAITLWVQSGAQGHVLSAEDFLF